MCESQSDKEAAVLLSHIIYMWKTCLLLPRDGHYWIVQPAREWMNAIGLTRTKYKQAIEVLVQQGEIDVLMTPLPGRVTHLRLLKRFTHLEEIPFDDESNPPGPFGRVRGSNADRLVYY
jgi:hypothetical protein